MIPKVLFGMSLIWKVYCFQSRFQDKSITREEDKDFINDS